MTLIEIGALSMPIMFVAMVSVLRWSWRQEDKKRGR